MLRIGLMTALLAGCASEDTTLLQALNGTWDGTVTVGAAPYATEGAFTWDEAQQLLSGQLNVSEPEAVHTYAVRRSSVTSTSVNLELTDALDGTRGLRVVGTVGTTFDGEATLRYACELGTCGYIGVLALTKGAATLGTPTGDTGP